MRALLFLLIGAAALTGLWFVMQPQAGPTGPQAANEARESRLFELDLGTPLPPGTDRTLRARQGEVVQLQLTAAGADEVHLHGYDRSLALEAGQVMVMTLLADKPGRFELESHDSHAVIAVLEVSPR